MPILVPVLLIGAGAATGLGGVANAVRGGQKMRRARRDASTAGVRYEAELSKTQEATSFTSAQLHAYGEFQRSSLDDVVQRMIDFMRRHDQKVTERASELLAGVEAGTQAIGDFQGGRVTAEGVAGHFVTTAVASAATYTGLPMAVAAYGSASTGTAISGLSGAAAQNAIMAWLGGGSVAAGGGGMALGAVALNAVAIGPAFLVGGLVLNGKGEKALTEAQRYCVEVESSIEVQQLLRTRLALIDDRVEELRETLQHVVQRGSEALNALESAEPFDPDAHVDIFRRALGYAFAVRDIIAVPVLDAEGNIEPETDRLVVLYRDMA